VLGRTQTSQAGPSKFSIEGVNRAEDRNGGNGGVAKPKLPVELRFISEVELETLTSVSRRTWQKHRLFGRGPRFYRLGGAIRYKLAEVLEWIEHNAVDSRANGDGPQRVA
jgi:predicted DNA-binding transcriptional regulator AlpA